MFQDIIGDCGEGCLRCLSGVCQICDALNNYIKVGDICVPNPLSDCLISFERNQCYQCKTGYYLTGENKCVKMDFSSELKIESCNEYKRADDCLACDIQTFKKNTICFAKSNDIDNCTQYSDINKCGICDFLLPSYNRTYCNPLPDEEDHCLLYNHPLSCDKCKPGYELNRNSFMNSQTQLQKLFFHLGFWREKFYNIVFNNPICERITYEITNCLEPDYDQMCRTCEFGYTLSYDRKSCFKKPLPPFDPRNRVPNCYKFQDKKYEKCSICLEGYYLSDGNSKCVPHTENVDNCQIRSQQVPNTCVQCDNEYYLDIDNIICVKRQNFNEIRNCAEFNRTKDECLYCASQHLFHFDNTRCSKEINNCVIYNTEQSILKCKECISGDYLSDFQTECIQGNNSIEGCLKYKSSKECIECRNKYFLNDAKCLSQNFFYNCDLYSVTEKDICLRCNEEGSNSKVVTECTQVDSPIQNCVLYNELKVCIQCIDDYVVVTRDGITACEQIPGCIRAELIPDPNDASKQITECKECMANHLFYKAQCINLASIENCLFQFSQNTTDSVSSYYFEADHVCQLCNANKYFKVAQHGVNTYLCVKRNEDMITDCLTYGQDDQGYICRECRRGYMPSTDQRTCSQIAVGTLLDGNLNKTYTDNELQTTTHWSNIPTNTEITDHCDIVSVDQTKCLQCKEGKTAMYYSTSIHNIVNNFTGNTNFSKFKRYLYNYIPSTDGSFDTSTKQLNEEYVWWSNPKVEYCKVNSTNDPKLQHKWQFILQKSQSDPTLTSNITYSCSKNIYYPTTTRDTTASTTLYKPYYDYSKLRIHYNHTLADVMNTADSSTVDQTYLNYYTDPTKRQAICDTNVISGCSRFMDSHQEDISNVLTFNTRMHSSCSLCESNQSLVYRNWTMGISTKVASNYTFPTEYFNWVQTECNLNTAIETAIDNCYIYEEMIYYGAKVTVCQQCNKLYYGNKATRNYYICPDDDPNYDYSQQDRCKFGYKCSEYYQCRPYCGGCSSTEYCARENGNSICKPRCNTAGGSTCNANEYCIDGTCMPYAQCQVYGDSWYKHNPTSYECLPTLCQNAFNKTHASRDIDQAAHQLLPQNSDGTYSRVHDDGSSQILYPSTYTDTTKNLAVETFFPDGTYFFWYPEDPTEQKLKKKWFDEIGLSILSYDEVLVAGPSTVHYNETVFYEANQGVTNNDFYDLNNNFQIFTNIDTNYAEIYKYRNYSNGSDIHEHIKDKYLEQFDSNQYIIYYEMEHTKYANENIAKVTHDYSDGSIRIDYRDDYNAMDYKVVFPDFIEHKFYHNDTKTIENVASDYSGEIILKVIYQDTEPNYEYIYYRDKPYYKKLNTQDGTGLITNFDVADVKQIIEFTSDTNTTTFKDVGGKERKERYKQGDNFKRIWEHKTDTQSYDEYFGTQEKPYPDLIPDKEVVYKSRRDNYLNDVFQNSQTIYKDSDDTTQLAVKTGIEFESQFYYHTVYDDISDYSIESPDYHYAIFTNNTIGRYHKDKSIGTFELFHEDGTRNELKSDGTWVTHDIHDTEIETLPSGAQVKVNFKGEEQTVENSIVILQDKILKQTGEVGGESVYYLDDNSIFQDETDDFYYKITKEDGSLIYKLKNDFTKVSIDASSNCEAYDKDLIVTKFTSNTNTKFLLKSENLYQQTQVDTDPLVSKNPLESELGAQTQLPMTGGCLDTLLEPDQATQFPAPTPTPPPTPPSDPTPPPPTPDSTPDPVTPLCPDLYETNCEKHLNHKLSFEYKTLYDVFWVYNKEGIRGFRSSYLDYVKFMGFVQTKDYSLDFYVESTTDFTLKKFETYQAGTITYTQIDEVNLETLKYKILNNNDNDLTKGTFPMTKSDYKENNVKVGDAYQYELRDRQFQFIPLTNNTLYIQTVDGFYNMTIDTNQELREHNKTLNRTWFNNGTYIDEPSYQKRTYIQGTETIIEDIITKTNTTTDSTRSGVTITDYISGYQIIDDNGVKTHKYINDTIMVENGNVHTYTYYNYQLPMLEVYYKDEFNTDTNQKTTTYFDERKEVMKLITKSDGSTEDHRRNGTIIHKDTSENVQYVYDSDNDIQYDKDGNILNAKINGVQYTYQVNTNTFLNTQGDGTITRLNLDDIKVTTSTSNEVPSITHYPDGRTATHSDYTKSSISIGDTDKYNLLIDGINKTYKSQNFGELILNEFELIYKKPSGNNIITYTYDMKTCSRVQESGLIQKIENCMIQEFGNGDISFNYYDQIIVFKVLGSIHFIDKYNKDDEISVVNLSYSISTLLRNGIINNLDIGNGDSIQMDSELKYWIFNNSTEMIDNLHEDLRTVKHEDSSFKYTKFYYADKTIESIKIDKSNQDLYKEIIKDNKDSYELTPTQEIYIKYNNYTLTKDISTGVIEKNYQWHPFISKEVYTPPDKKQINFKQRYQDYYGIKSMIYVDDKVHSQIDLQDQTWLYNDSTLKFELNNKVYDANTRTTITTDTTATQIIVTTEYYNKKMIKEITYSDLTNVLQKTEKYFKGYKETYYHEADPSYELIIEYVNGYTVKYPSTQTPDHTTQTDKTVVISSAIFGNYDYNFVTGSEYIKNYNTDYENVVYIDYTNELIYIKVDEIMDNNDITFFNTITITGAPLTLTGSITATSFTAADPIILTETQQILLKTLTAQQTISQDMEIIIQEPVYLTNGVQTRVDVGGTIYLKVTGVDSIVVEPSTNYKAIATNSIATSTSENLSKMVLTPDVQVVMTSTASTYEQAATQIGKFAEGSVIDGNIQGLTIEDMDTFTMKDGYATTTGVGTSTLHGGTYTFDAQNVPFTKNAGYAGYMIYDGSTGTVSEINDADYVLTVDPIYHEKSEFKLLAGWDNSHIGLVVKDPYSDVLLTGQINVTGSTSTFGHSTSTLALGTTVSLPLANTTLYNFKFRLPNSATITIPKTIWVTGLNHTSTGNKGVLYNFSTAGVTIENMVIKAPWSLAPASVDTTVKVKITGGTIAIVNGEITDSKANGQVDITGTYTITNPVIETWTTGFSSINLVSGQVTADKGQLNIPAPTVNIQTTSSANYGYTACTWSLAGTTHTGNYLEMGNFNYAHKTYIAARNASTSITGAGITIKNFLTLTPTGADVVLTFHDTGSSAFTIDAFATGMSGTEGVYTTSTVIGTIKDYNQTTDLKSFSSATIDLIQGTHFTLQTDCVSGTKCDIVHVTTAGVNMTQTGGGTTKYPNGATLTGANGQFFHSPFVGTALTSTASSLTVTSGTLDTKPSTSSTLTLSNFDNDSIEVTGSTYTFNSIFTKDTGSFSIASITDFKPAAVFSVNGECVTSTTNVSCTINDTSNTAANIETTVTNLPLTFTAPTDSIKLDATASKTFTVSGTGGTVTIEDQTLDVTAYSNLKVQIGGVRMNIVNTHPYSATYAPSIKFTSNSAVTTNTFQVSNEKFSVQGDGTMTFTGTLNADVKLKDIVSLQYTGDKYELDIQNNTKATVGNTVAALTSGSITDVKAYTTLANGGEIVLESDSTISTKGTTFTIPITNLSVETTKAVVDDPTFVGTGQMNIVGGTKTIPDGMEHLKYIPTILSQSNPLTMLYGNLELSLFDNQDEWIKDRTLDYGLRFLSTGEMVKAFDDGFIERYLTDGSIIKQTDVDERYVQVDSTTAYLDKFAERRVYHQTLDATGSVSSQKVYTYDDAEVTEAGGNKVYTYSNGNVITVSPTEQIFETGSDYKQTKNLNNKNIKFEDLTTDASLKEQNYEYYNYNYIQKDDVTEGINNKGQRYWSKLTESNIIKNNFEEVNDNGANLIHTTNSLDRLVKIDTSGVITFKDFKDVQYSKTIAGNVKTYDYTDYIHEIDDDNNTQTYTYKATNAVLVKDQNDNVTITYSANFIVTYIHQDYFTIKKDNVIEKCDKTNLKYTKTTDGTEDTSINGLIVNSKFGETILTGQQFYCSYSKNKLVLKSSQGSYVFNIENSNYYHNKPNEVTYLEGLLYDGKKSYLMGGYFFIDEKIFDPITGKLMKFKQNVDIEETMLDSRAINDLKRLIKLDLKEEQKMNYGKSRNFEQDKSRKEVLQDTQTRHDKFTQHQLYLRTDNYFTEFDLLTSTVWQEGFDYPKTLNLLKNQLIRQYSNDKSTRVFWTDDTNSIYTSTLKNDVNYFNDILHSESSINVAPKMYGYTDQYNQAQRLYSFTEDLWYVKYTSDDAKQLKSTSQNTYENSDQSIVYSNGIQTETTGTVVKEINILSIGSSQDGADVSTKKNYDFGGLVSYNIDEGGTPMVQEDNVSLNYVAKYNPATEIKNYVFENLIEIKDNQSSKTLTYTYPAQFVATKVTPPVTTAVIDYSSDTIKGVSLQLANGDNSVDFTFQDRTKPSQISGNTWSDEGQGYTVSYSGGGVSKSLYFQQMEQDFMLTYNSYSDSNTANQIKFSFYSFNPYFTIFHGDVDNYYTYYFLNGTALRVDDRDVDDKTKEYFYLDDTQTLYAKEYFKQTNLIQAYTEYYSNPAKTITHVFADNKITYTFPEYDRIVQFNGDGTQMLTETTNYKIIVQGLEQTIYDYGTEIETGNFQNSTVREIQADPLDTTKNMTSWTYSNGTKFISKLFQVPSANLEQHTIIEYDNDLTYTVFPNETIKTHYAGNETYFLEYEDTNIKTIEKYTTAAENMIYRRQDFKTGDNAGDYQIFHQSTQNTTYYLVQDNLTKNVNPQTSYTIDYPYPSPKDPVEQEKFYSITDTNAFTGSSPQTDAPSTAVDFKIYYYVNNEVKEEYYNSGNIYKEVYKYTNSTIKTTNYNTNSIDQIVYDFRLSVAGISQWWKKMEFQYFNYGKTDQKLHKIVKTNHLDYVTIEDFYPTLSSNTLPNTKKINENSITPANGDQVFINNSTHARRNVFENQVPTLEVFIDGIIFKDNLNVLHHEDQQSQEYQFQNNTRKLIFDNRDTVFIFPDEFIYSGCWWKDQVCARNKCYFNLKCRCAQNEYCKWDPDATDVFTYKGKNVCIADSNCDQCQLWNKYCWKFFDTNNDPYFQCRDEPQESTAPDTTCDPVCPDDEMCIDSQCIYKGNPCYFKEPSTAVFCAVGEICKDEKCYQGCRPTCFYYQDCIYNQTQDKFICQDKEQGLPLTSIQSCDLIENCLTTNEFGECQRCILNYSLLREEIGGIKVINRKKCVLTNVNNCDVAKVSGPGSYGCEDYSDIVLSGELLVHKGCHQGYTYINGQCQMRTELCLDYDELGHCRFCSSKYSNEVWYSVYAQYDTGVCTDKPSSASLFSDDVIPTEKEKLFNCKYFSYYYPIATSQKPIDAISEGKNYCEVCNDTHYMNFNKYCLPKNIDNCDTYDENTTWNDQANSICTKCKVGYLLDNNSCLWQGPPSHQTYYNLPKCIAYKIITQTINDFNLQTYQCVACEYGYYLFETNVINRLGQNAFCFQESPYRDCNKIDTDHFTSTGQIKCKECKPIRGSAAYPNPIQLEKDYINSCVFIPKRENCKYHVLKSIYDDTTFECEECISTHYLFTYIPAAYVETATEDAIKQIKICKPRLVIMDDCIKYYIDQDACEQRNIEEGAQITEGQSLPIDVQILLNSPPPSELEIENEQLGDWIMGCEVYKDAKNCLKCYAPKYNNPEGFDYNNRCINVDIEIPNCKYYNQNQECEECQEFYLLIDKQCKLKKVKNCEEYLNEFTCKTCPAQYPYLDQDGNCSKHPSNPWCKNYQIFSNQEILFEDSINCETCQEGYYPDNDDKCNLLQKSIPHCKYYYAETLCKECEVGFYLQYDGKVCVINPQFDTNCESFIYNTQCSVCRFKYIFEGDQCVPCGANLEEGCAYCDPSNKDQCFLCRIGYYMKDGKCELLQSGSTKSITDFAYSQKHVSTIKKQGVSNSYRFILKTFIGFLILLCN